MEAELILKARPKKEADEPISWASAKPMRAFAGFPVAISPGRLMRTTLQELQTKVWETERFEPQVLEAMPSLDIELVQMAREAFMSAGTGIQGVLGPGQTILLSAVEWLYGRERTKALLEKAAQTKPGTIPPASATEAFLESIAKRKISDIPAALRRTDFFLLSPAFQLYRNVDYYATKLENLGKTGGKKAGYVLANVLTAGPLPPMPVSIPTIEEATQSYVESWKHARATQHTRTSENEEWRELPENVALAAKHAELMYQASALVGAANILSSVRLLRTFKEAGPAEVGGMVPLLGTPIGPRLHQIEAYVYFRGEEGKPVPKRVVLEPVVEPVPAEDEKKKATLPERFLAISVEDAPAGVPPMIRVSGVVPIGVRKEGEEKAVIVGQGEELEAVFPVLPHFFAGFVSHAPDAPTATPSLQELEELRGKAPDIADLVEIQLASRTPNKVYEGEMKAKQGFAEQHGKAQLLYAVVTRLAEHAVGLPSLRPSAIAVQRFLDVLLGPEATEPHSALRTAGVHKVALIMPSEEGFRGIFYTRGEHGTEVSEGVVTPEALQTVLPQVFQAVGSTRLTPVGGVNIDPTRPFAIVEPMRTETRIPPYGLVFGGYIGPPGRKRTELEVVGPAQAKRGYYLFNVPERGEVIMDAPAIYQALVRMLWKRSQEQ